MRRHALALGLLAMLVGTANAYTQEDQADEVCTAAANVFYKLADKVHGQVKAMNTPAARSVFLKGFEARWSHYSISGEPQAAIAFLKTWLLESYNLAVTVDLDALAMSEATAKPSEREDIYRGGLVMAQDAVVSHCMYVLGKLDGQGRLQTVFGPLPSS